MAKLQDKIGNDIKDAMRSKDAETLLVLRMVKAAMGNLAIEKKKDDLSDEDVLGVLQKQAKQRRESIESFEKGGRPELVEKEKKELEILKKYLPEQLGEDEIKKLAQEAIQSTGATQKAQMGQVMKALMPKIKGRADGKTVNQVVNSLLE